MTCPQLASSAQIDLAHARTGQPLPVYSNTDSLPTASDDHATCVEPVREIHGIVRKRCGRYASTNAGNMWTIRARVHSHSILTLFLHVPRYFNILSTWFPHFPHFSARIPHFFKISLPLATEVKHVPPGCAWRSCMSLPFVTGGHTSLSRL